MSRIKRDNGIASNLNIIQERIDTLTDRQTEADKSTSLPLSACTSEYSLWCFSSQSLNIIYDMIYNITATYATHSHLNALCVAYVRHKRYLILPHHFHLHIFVPKFVNSFKLGMMANDLWLVCYHFKLLKEV